MINGLSERLKTLRWEYGYSQKQIADKLGVSPALISGYETGERTPSAEMLLSLSYLYNTSVDYLLGKQAAPANHTISTDGLTQKQINAIKQLIRSFADE